MGWLSELGAYFQPPMQQQTTGLSALDQQAMMPETFANPFVRQSLASLGTLPQRAFQSSETMRMGGGYDPAPIVEAATLPMGPGLSIGAGARAGEMALGSGALRPNSSGFSVLENARILANQNGIRDLVAPPTPAMDRLRRSIKGMNESEALDSDAVWYLARHLHDTKPGGSFSSSFNDAAKQLLGRPLTTQEISKAMVDAAAAGIGR